ncbi:MAG: hypothetical protein CMN77_16170 [Spirochaetaceae bacterium]|nr:hypothetical protein [Spirochaetaceae bacterium]
MPIMNNGESPEMRKRHARIRLFILALVFLIPAAVVIAYSPEEDTTEVNHRRITVYDGGGIVQLAQQYLGVPYRPGGNSPSGFDCSGLTSFVYREAGYSIPRSASSQYNALRPVRVPEAGDLVFFRTDGSSISHVGIYLGNYRFIHAPSSGKTVSIADLRLKYWKNSYAGARTIFQPGE